MDIECFHTVKGCALLGGQLCLSATLQLTGLELAQLLLARQAQEFAITFLTLTLR